MLPPLTATKLFPYTTLFRSTPVSLFPMKEPGPGFRRRPPAGSYNRMYRHEPARPQAILVGCREDWQEVHLQFSQRLLRSEEHTSELQSRGHLVCRLLLEKKK